MGKSKNVCLSRLIIHNELYLTRSSFTYKYTLFGEHLSMKCFCQKGGSDEADTYCASDFALPQFLNPPALPFFCSVSWRWQDGEHVPFNAPAALLAEVATTIRYPKVAAPGRHRSDQQ